MIYGLFFGFCVIAYLCGSVNFAIITTKAFTGGDVRSSGSGNAGMTNVMRTAGFLPGVITFFGDYIKAIAAVALGKYILPELAKRWIPDLSAETLAILPIYGALFAGFFCLLGQVAVGAFLEGRIEFSDIPVITEKTMEKIKNKDNYSLEDILSCDKEAREIAKGICDSICQ